MPFLTSTQRKTLFTTLALVNLAYFMTSGYIRNSNEGSHFALVSAIVEERSVEISRFLAYTRGVDYAVKDGRNYSDRTPGTALLSIPFYVYGKLVRDSGLGKYLSRRPNIAEIFVLFLPNISATLSVFLMFLLSMSLGFHFGIALASSLLFAFTTLVWQEGSHFFSHAQSMVALFGAAYLVITIPKFGPSHAKSIMAVAVLLGLAAIIEIVNLLHLPVFAVYVLAAGKLQLQDIRNSGIFPLLFTATAVFLAILSILLLYNAVAFGELTVKSNKYNPNFPESSFATALSGDPMAGVDRILTNFRDPQLIFSWKAGTKNNIPGLLIVSPILLLSLAGFYYFARSHKHEALLFASLVTTQVAVICMLHKPLTRHVITILPFLFFPLTYIVAKSLMPMTTAAANIPKSLWPWLLIGAMALYSAARVFYVIATYHGRSLATPFPFIREMPSYFFFYGTLAVAYIVYSCIRGGRFWSWPENEGQLHGGKA